MLTNAHYIYYMQAQVYVHKITRTGAYVCTALFSFRSYYNGRY